MMINVWFVLLGLKVGVLLGFNNSYVLVMCEVDVVCLGIVMIFDFVVKGFVLKFGLLYEFIVCVDGWLVL